MTGIMTSAVCLHHFRFGTQKVLGFCCTECTTLTYISNRRNFSKCISYILSCHLSECNTTASSWSFITTGIVIVVVITFSVVELNVFLPGLQYDCQTCSKFLETSIKYNNKKSDMNLKEWY
jgi:hypothetical protein